MRLRAPLATVIALGALATVGAAGVALPAAARGQTRRQVIALEPLVSKLSAYGGVLVWSHWDAKAKVFRLSARFRGRTEILPIRPRSVPFDVDLGPDPKGRAVAVYSRCRHEQPAWIPTTPGARIAVPGGCALYRYDFVTRREQRIARIVGAGSGSFYLPSIWRDEIAYVRARGTGTPAVFVQPLSAPRRHRIVALALRGGPSGAPGPVSLDLRGTELAFAWEGTAGAQLDSEIHLDTFSATRTLSADVLDAESSEDRSPGLLGFPSLTGAGLFYGRFDGSAITPNDDAFELGGPGGSTTAAAPHALRGQTRDGSTTYAMYGPYAGTFANCGLAGCTLTAFVGLSYR